METQEKPTHTPGEAEGLYNRLKAKRYPYLFRAWECAELTIPSLLPRMGHTSTTKLKTPFQGIGARGVNNLASKLILALLPPNSPFFRLMVDKFTLQKLTESPDAKTEVEKALGTVEDAVMVEIESSSDRVSVFEAMKHLIVCGNSLLYMPKGEAMQVFQLDRYVVKRDPSGNVLHIITKEVLSPLALPEEVRQLIDEPSQDIEGIPSDDTTTYNSQASNDEVVNIYTHIYRDGKRWRTYQEVKGIKIPGSIGSYPLDKSPYIVLRYTKIDGEDYGRSFIDEYLGDLKTLEGLTIAVTEGSAAAAKILFLVKPNGVTRKKSVAEAENGAIIEGDAEDVTVLQANKYYDFKTASERMDKIEARLSFAFLLNSSVQRNGERVTAEEIRYMAGELEDALGGLYSILAQEFQLPYVNRKMVLTPNLPKLPKEIVKTTIVTGLEALGRGHDLNKLDLLISGLAQALGPQVISQYVNISDYITRRATALGIDTDGLIRTDEEVQQQQQQMQQQQMMQQFGPEVIKQGGGMMQKMMEKQGNNSQQQQGASK